MSHDEFKPVVDLAKSKAPDGWTELRVQYRYYDDAADLKTHFKRSGSSDWKSFDGSEFEVMDIFDAYRDTTHPDLDEPWSVLILTIKQTGEMDVAFEYGDPGMFDF